MNRAHDHSHHEISTTNRAFMLGVLLNMIFVVVEIVFGLMADSLALLTDAGHNFSDVLALLLAWGAIWLAGRKPTARHTYGYSRGTILASLLSALMLLVAVGIIVWEAVDRLQTPTPVAGKTMMFVAGLGVLINTGTALLFMKGSSHDLNIRGAFLHMAADAVVSLGVVIAGGLILWTGNLWIDPIISLVIAVVIFLSTWGLLRDSLNLAFDAVPTHIDVQAVEELLRTLPGVTAIHDLHIWAMSTSDTALTVHLVMPEGSDDAFLVLASEQLSERFRIGHSTMQIEAGVLDTHHHYHCQGH